MEAVLLPHRFSRNITPQKNGFSTFRAWGPFLSTKKKCNYAREINSEQKGLEATQMHWL